jgi:hypothetical protein
LKKILDESKISNGSDSSRISDFGLQIEPMDLSGAETASSRVTPVFDNPTKSKSGAKMALPHFSDFYKIFPL